LSKKQRELKADYKREPRPTGVYAVRNIVTHVAFVGTSTDLPGILNRHRFELKLGGHRNTELAKAHKEFGPEAFVFEVLDTLEPRDKVPSDLVAELDILLELRMEQGLKTKDGENVRLVPMY